MESPCGSGCVNQSTTLSWNRGSLAGSVLVWVIVDRVGGLLYHFRVQLIPDEGYRAWIKVSLNVCYQPMHGVAASPVWNDRGAARGSQFEKQWLPEVSIHAIDVNLCRAEAQWVTPKPELIPLA